MSYIKDPDEPTDSKLARAVEKTSDQHSGAAPGWVGGFAESNPAFAYPDPDLTSLKILDNMDNIDLLQRQQKARWPQFSWEAIPGKTESRCFQMFSPDISRIGYTDTGRVYSIICPQQGHCSPSLGCLNIEVTVTGQRGWVDEDEPPHRQLAADMSVEGRIWLSPSAHENPLVKLLWKMFKKSNLPFPSSKKNAIRVTTHEANNSKQKLFTVRRDESTLFDSPEFARHHDEAWAVQNLGVEIGPIVKTNNPIVDDFNELIMDVVNLASGNMLQAGNLLTWNIWSTAPEVVDTKEWQDHAEKWRESIDADYGSPTSPGTKPQHFDGSSFKPVDNLVDQELDKVLAFLEKHLHNALFPG